MDKYAKFNFLLVDGILRMWSSLAAMVTFVCILISIQQYVAVALVTSVDLILPLKGSLCCCLWPLGALY